MSTRRRLHFTSSLVARLEGLLDINQPFRLVLLLATELGVRSTKAKALTFRRWKAMEDDHGHANLSEMVERLSLKVE